jgi:hypothetical protein
MRMRVALFALLIPSLAWAGNTCTTTSTGSNWSSSSHWSCTPSGTVPGNGDVAIIDNATTVDVNTTVGQSGPGIANAGIIPKPTLTQTSGGGSLPAGSYTAVFTVVDSSGKESAPGNESAAFTLTSGYTLNVALESLPAGVSSMKLYLTNTGGGSLTEHLYASGITTSTYAATSASWNNGTQTYTAAAALPQNWAIWINSASGTLTLGTSVALTVRGDVMQGKAGIVVDCGSTWKFDSSASAGTTNNPYTVVEGDNEYHPAVSLASSGSCSSNPWTITSNLSSGAPGAFLLGTYANGAGDPYPITLAYGTVSNCGSSTSSCMNAINFAFTVANVIFNNTGTTNASPGATYNFSVTNSSWLNDNDAYNSGLSGYPSLFAQVAAASTGTRVFTGNIFDNPPALEVSSAWTWSNNYFDNSLLAYTGSTASFTYTSSFFRGPSNNGTHGLRDYWLSPISGQSVTNSYLLEDWWPAASVTSTATSATASTLTDTSQAWTTNAYQGTGSLGWIVTITGGTGANQTRAIASNTATTLTLSSNWTVTPNSTSTYQIYNGPPHWHGVQSAAGTISGNIFDTTAAEISGDSGECFLDSTATAAVVQNNIVLPDGSGLDTACSLINYGSSSGSTVSANHNTSMVGTVSPYVGDYSGVANMISSYKNNLFWTFSGTSGGGGPWKITDSGHDGGGGTIAYVSATNANYNACWNCNAGNYSGKGYNLYTSGTQAGANDVTLTGSTASSGPNFVAPTRNFVSWCESLGVTGSIPSIVSTCRANMMSQNNFSGVPSGFTISALITYVTAGFAPQDSALHNAASDGTDIGAVAYQALPNAAVPVHSAVIF